VAVDVVGDYEVYAVYFLHKGEFSSAKIFLKNGGFVVGFAYLLAGFGHYTLRYHKWAVSLKARKSRILRQLFGLFHGL
jgi:hypothetical protein